ncbi:MAG: hypothetical protein ACK4NC_07440 [Candidatus Gracilibacteria bacterium]
MTQLIKNRDELEIALHIEANYIFTGEPYTHEELADKYGVSVQLIKKLATKRKWEEKSREIRSFIREQIFLYTIAAKFPDLLYITEELDKTHKKIETLEEKIDEQLYKDSLSVKDIEAISRSVETVHRVKMGIIKQKQELIEKAKERIQGMENMLKNPEVDAEAIIHKLKAYLEAQND